MWKEKYREVYLNEFLRWEGRGDALNIKHCPDCVARGVEEPATPEYRCRDCFLPDLVCRGCCIRRHRVHCFHSVEVSNALFHLAFVLSILQRWAGNTFMKTSLKALGLRVQLNHLSMRCSAPVPCASELRVFHTNGIHDVAIDYCGCERAIPNHVQLLRRGLYPASQVTVKTCVTFRLLEQTHLLALTTKASTYDIYRALEKLTNNTGVSVPTSRYRAFGRVGVQYRHLKLVKRGGRGHDPSGVKGTKDGEVGLECPSCPHPGKNLPSRWEDAPPESK